MVPAKYLKIAMGICLAVAAIGAAQMAEPNRLSGRKGAPLPIPGLRNAPVLHLELARNEEDLKAVLMQGDTARNLRDARTGISLDTWLFIPGYAGFLLAAGVLISRKAIWLRWFTLVAVPAIAVLDRAENFGISRALDHIAANGSPTLADAAHISVPSVAKWTLLVLVLLADSVALNGPRASWRGRLLGVLFLVPGLAIAAQLATWFHVRFQ